MTPLRRVISSHFLSRSKDEEQHDAQLLLMAKPLLDHIVGNIIHSQGDADHSLVRFRHYNTCCAVFFYYNTFFSSFVVL